MIFADLKNDFAFRRIFATHPDILRGLLNDLLDRRGERAVASIEYLPSHTAPRIARNSILGVACRDHSGTGFVVEIQLLHVPGFMDLAIVEACNALRNAFRPTIARWDDAEVVTVSISEFDLWPDGPCAPQRVPMLSSWNVLSRSWRQTDQARLVRATHVFLDLTRLPERSPQTAVEWWAWLFARARTLSEVPSEAPPGACRDALALANLAAFGPTEIEAYERVIQEIQMTHEYVSEATAKLRASGNVSVAVFNAKVRALLTLLDHRGLSVDDAHRARIAACNDLSILDRWIARAVTAATAEDVIGRTSEQV